MLHWSLYLRPLAWVSVVQQGAQKGVSTCACAMLVLVQQRGAARMLSASAPVTWALAHFCTMFAGRVAARAVYGRMLLVQVRGVRAVELPCSGFAALVRAQLSIRMCSAAVCTQLNITSQLVGCVVCPSGLAGMHMVCTRALAAHACCQISPCWGRRCGAHSRAPLNTLTPVAARPLATACSTT